MRIRDGKTSLGGIGSEVGGGWDSPVTPGDSGSAEDSSRAISPRKCEVTCGGGYSTSHRV